MTGNSTRKRAVPAVGATLVTGVDLRRRRFETYAPIIPGTGFHVRWPQTSSPASVPPSQTPARRGSTAPTCSLRQSLSRRTVAHGFQTGRGAAATPHKRHQISGISRVRRFDLLTANATRLGLERRAAPVQQPLSSLHSAYRRRTYGPARQAAAREGVGQGDGLAPQTFRVSLSVLGTPVKVRIR
jgi:hypothetical protein